MAHPLFSDEQQYYPPEYKIVDLPLVEIPIYQTLQTFNAKVYRLSGQEWKRCCHGKVKFIKADYIVVSAFENFSCHQRMKEIPINDSTKFELQPSEQFAYNWVFKCQQGIKLSIALLEADFHPFYDFWEEVKAKNSLVKQEKWLQEIEFDLFD